MALGVFDVDALGLGIFPALVGIVVGFTETDGFNEGFILVLILGCDDGFSEGLAESDGFNEGSKVGLEDEEGIEVGLFDGFIDTDGFDDGFKVGIDDEDGVAVIDDDDGASEGATATSVGSPIHATLSNSDELLAFSQSFK